MSTNPVFDKAVKEFTEKRNAEIAVIRARKEAEKEAKAKAKREMLRAEREEYATQKKAAKDAEKAAKDAERAEEARQYGSKSIAQATLISYVKQKNCVSRELLPTLYKEFLPEFVYLLLASESDKDVSREQVRQAIQPLLD